MALKNFSFKSQKPAVYVAPWEKAFERVLSPIDEFIQKQSTSSMLLMVCGIIALIIANSPWSSAYQHLLHEPLAVRFANTIASMSLLHWVNDGLMALFFLIVGLELKRELLVGELSDWRRAMLPLLAAIGGMAVPASLYYLFNPDGIAAAGWGIPMATDIAFAVGALSLLGNRIPRSLIIFLIALAIVDDLGAVIVIALFYTSTIYLPSLALSLFLLAVLVAFNLGGVQRLLPYLLVGFLLWCATLGSGIHATIAGVALAFCIPIRPKYNPAHFVREVNKLSRQMETSLGDDERFHSQVSAMEKGMKLVQAPAKRLEHGLHLYVAYLVIPIFALANAGIPIQPGLIIADNTASSNVVFGILAGLVFGKLIGIAGVTWLALKTKVAELPADLDMCHIIGIGLLGGIGFTMSIFIADLAFTNHPQELLAAKTGILLASLISGISGISWLWFYKPAKPI